ncbi:MAG: putative signal-transduction protein with domain [Hyphomicrobiales bacterium]|nr:putative signal-transduction protein with domain [Hyphomicrobiales bacterium]
MTVSRILAIKGRDVITTQPHRTLAEVAQLLSEKGIGALVVTDVSGEVLGIVSERDVVRAVARQGAVALDDTVARHMTVRVVTARETSTINGLMQQMTAGRFRHVPVTENGRLVGLISIGDVVKHRLEEYENEQKALKDYIATA